MAFTTPGTAVAGDVLTAAFWNSNVRDNTDALYGNVRRLAYQTSTSNQTTTTSFATAPNLVSDATFTANGTSSYLVEVYIPLAETGGTNGSYIDIRFDIDNVDIALISRITRSEGTNASSASVFARFFYTFASGSRAVNMRPVHVGTAGTVYGTQGLPIALAIYGPPLT